MRFSEFLKEKAMNQKVYSDTESRLGDIARVGYEFEMAIPSDSPLYPDEHSRETDDIDDYTDYSDVKRWFDISLYDENRIDREFDEWKDDRKKDYIKDNYEQYLDDDNDIGDREAMEMASDEYDKTEDPDFRDFLEDQYHGKLSALLDNHSCPPSFGWADEKNGYFYTSEAKEDFDGVAEICKKSLERYVTKDVEINGTPSISNQIFSITQDGSIVGDTGIELVTPPAKLKAALDHVENVCDWMHRNDVITNSSTGLHINISLPNLKDRVDPLKLLLFMGEQYISQQFGRSSNTYANQHLPKLIDYIKQGKSIPSTEHELLGDSWKMLQMNTKYMTVNFKKLADGYLEFRAPGGNDYHYNTEKIKQTTLRMVTALEIACDPVAERNEYIKKIYKLFGNIDASAERNQKAFKDLDIPKSLIRLYTYDQRHIAQALHEYNHDLISNNVADQKYSLLILINTARSILGRVRKTLDEKERAYFKKEAKRIGLTTKDVDDYFGDAPEKREPFRRDTGL